MEKSKADIWPKTSTKKDENSLAPVAPRSDDGETDNLDRVSVQFQDPSGQAIEADIRNLNLDPPAASDPSLKKKEERKGKKRNRSSNSAPQASRASDMAGVG